VLESLAISNANNNGSSNQNFDSESVANSVAQPMMNRNRSSLYRSALKDIEEEYEPDREGDGARAKSNPPSINIEEAKEESKSVKGGKKPIPSF
jgi:hypothetical protein